MNHYLGKNILEKKKKKRPTLSHQFKKNIKRYAINWSKEKKKTP